MAGASIGGRGLGARGLAGLGLIAAAQLSAIPAARAAPTFTGNRADTPFARRAYELLLKACPMLPRAVAAFSKVTVVPDGGGASTRIGPIGNIPPAEARCYAELEALPMAA